MFGVKQKASDASTTSSNCAILSAGGQLAPTASRRGATDTSDKTFGSGRNFTSAERAATYALRRTTLQTSRGRVLTKPIALISKC